MGCDDKTCRKNHRYAFQSTHPCGVRLYRYRVRIGPKCFNPRTRVGCDPLAINNSLLALAFQSTHPCGVRRLKKHYDFLIISFNPRTRVGCDDGYRRFRFAYIVSIHAPVWGATCLLTISMTSFCFNPRTRVGCDAFFIVDFA